MAKPQNEKKVVVKVLRPWMYGALRVPVTQGEGDSKADIVVELPETLGRDLIADKKAELSAEKPNFVLPKRK